MPTATPATPNHAETAEHSALAFAEPTPPPDNKPWIRQSLTHGTAGIALLHIQRAHAGYGTWQRAHRWITAAVAEPVSASSTAGLYQGAPAITLMLDAAAAGKAGHYRRPLAEIESHVVALAHRRVDAAARRMKTGELPEFREFDAFFGLAGLGALLLRRAPGGSALERVLGHLVALTKPLTIEGHVIPGWWVGHDPHRRHSAAYRRGHGNFGMAHGIAGPLAVLSQAMRRGAIVDGHDEAIGAICDWLDAWRQDDQAGSWWPEWITLDELHRGHPNQPGPARPSWCYGTPGIARAGQLASIATGDLNRQRSYEQALLDCLKDPAQQARINDSGLCHGWAGIYQTVWRAAQNAINPELAGHLPALAMQLASDAAPDQQGLLEGKAGTALALHTVARNVAPLSGWDTCLLID